jgi:hypothetical protein
LKEWRILSLEHRTFGNKELGGRDETREDKVGCPYIQLSSNI